MNNENSTTNGTSDSNDKMENLTYTREAFDNLTEAKDPTENLPEVENYTESLTKVVNASENLTEIENVTENLAEVKNASENLTKIENVTENLAEVENASENLTKIGNVTENLTEIKNDTENLTIVENASENLAAVENDPENLTEIKNACENLTEVENVTDNLAEVENLTKVENDAKNVTKNTDTTAKIVDPIKAIDKPCGFGSEIVCDKIESEKLALLDSLSNKISMESVESLSSMIDKNSIVNKDISTVKTAVSKEANFTRNKTTDAPQDSSSISNVFVSGEISCNAPNLADKPKLTNENIETLENSMVPKGNSGEIPSVLYEENSSKKDLIKEGKIEKRIDVLSNVEIKLKTKPENDFKISDKKDNFQLKSLGDVLEKCDLPNISEEVSAPESVSKNIFGDKLCSPNNNEQKINTESSIGDNFDCALGPLLFKNAVSNSTSKNSCSKPENFEKTSAKKETFKFNFETTNKASIFGSDETQQLFSKPLFGNQASSKPIFDKIERDKCKNSGNTLFGKASENTLFNKAPENTLFSKAPEDKLFSKASENTLFNKAPENTLFSKAPENKLFSKAREDKLFSKAPDNTLFKKDTEGETSLVKLSSEKPIFANSLFGQSLENKPLFGKLGNDSSKQSTLFPKTNECSRIISENSQTTSGNSVVLTTDVVKVTPKPSVVVQEADTIFGKKENGGAQKSVFNRLDFGANKSSALLFNNSVNESTKKTEDVPTRSLAFKSNLLNENGELLHEFGPVITEKFSGNYVMPDHLENEESNYVKGYVVPKLEPVAETKKLLEKIGASNINDLDYLSTITNDVHELTQTESMYYGSTSFTDMGLHPLLLKGLFDMGFIKPSRIQEATFSVLVHEKRSIVAQSQNGTGKTGAFVLSLICNLDATVQYPEAIVLAPTFELAIQINDVIKKMTKYMPAYTTALGVKGQRPDTSKQITAKIIVGTPGTVADWCCKFKIVDCSKIKMFVLDEADILISKEGHLSMVVRVKKFLPTEKCQFLLFSATYPQRLCSFANFVVKNPFVLRVRSEQLSLDNVQQYYTYIPKDEEKFAFIWNLFSSIRIIQCIIFCKTRAGANQLADNFKACRFKASVISGDMPVEQRNEAIQRLREGKDKVLISTNVFARGIDIKTTTLVINFDVPALHYNNQIPDFETYLHRVGRAGRFGNRGICVTVAQNDMEISNLSKIQAYFDHTINPIHPWLYDDLTKLDPVSTLLRSYVKSHFSQNSSDSTTTTTHQ